MINLIRNELTKISKKKSIYITLLITLAFIIIANFIYQMSNDGYSYDVSQEIEFYEEQLKGIDLKTTPDKEMYLSYETQLRMNKLIQKYGDSGTWQAKIINEQGYELIGQLVHCEYMGASQAELEQVKAKYEDFVAKLGLGDWKYFTKEKLKNVEASLEEQTKLKQTVTSQEQIKELEYQIAELEDTKQVINWRLEKDICYGYDYYNQCLSMYQMSKSDIRSYENSNQPQLSEKEQYENKQSYYKNLERAAICQYDIEHGTKIGDSSTAKSILLNVFSEYEIFIIIMAVMIAGTIVSEEFNKGTVKLLLIKPYKRRTILTAKFITCIIMLMIVILSVMLMQFVVGGMIQGFDSFGEPAIVYDHTTNQLQEMSTVKYLAMQTLGKLPIYVLLVTLAFSLSTIFTNSALAIAITLLGSMGSSLVNAFATAFNLWWIKFFVTPNWDLTQYFFGGLPEFQGLTVGFSIAIIVIYMVAMLVPTYITFKKKNIKNI